MCQLCTKSAIKLLKLPVTDEIGSTAEQSASDRESRCWAVQHLLCLGRVEGSRADKYESCINPEIFKKRK